MGAVCLLSGFVNNSAASLGGLPMAIALPLSNDAAFIQGCVNSLVRIILGKLKCITLKHDIVMYHRWYKVYNVPPVQ